MLTAKMLEITKEEIDSAQSFSKEIMGKAFDKKMSAKSLLIAAKALEHAAMDMIVHGDNAECDCEDCRKKFKEEMN